MKLNEIIDSSPFKNERSVPDWMIGAFKRRSISFANGLTDTDTFVFWLQSNNLTIDLRLPIEVERVDVSQLGSLTEKQFRTLINYEGWYAESKWENQQLSWSGGTCFQTHNRWPEPAELKRIGDCMVEFAPSGAYLEDWRLLSRNQGPLVGLKLIDEVDLDSGSVRHKDGALIINGNWAGIVLGRPAEPEVEHPQLRDLVSSKELDPEELKQIFQFETSIAQGSLDDGYTIKHSTNQSRTNQGLFPLDGFSWHENRNSAPELHQEFEDNGLTIRRRFIVDTALAEFNYSSATPQSETAAVWFEHENETLGRYLQIAPS